MTRAFTWFNLTSVIIGFAFLYIPLALIVIYSFNASALVTVWGGWSLKWYGELFRDEQMLSAAWLTLRLGIVSATVATILGTMAALALVRYGRFWGRTLFSGMVYAPIVMPEVITGLSFILLFVAVGLAKGFWTLLIAHISFTMCFVAVTVQARILSFDRSVEEAAMDLGCPPFKTFFLITLPLIFPAVVAGWLLAFTLSIDDVVIANFTNGPGYTPLPIEIWSSVRRGVSPKINAVCTILIGIVAFGAITATIIQKFQLQKREAEERAAARA
jgi:putrescine transport system permease protein